MIWEIAKAKILQMKHQMSSNEMNCQKDFISFQNVVALKPFHSKSGQKESDLSLNRNLLKNVKDLSPNL